MSAEKPPLTSPRPTVEFDDAQVSGHKEDIFFAAIETTRMPMLVTDPHQPDNPIIFANRAFNGMSGYTPEEVIGRNCRFLQGPETDREAVTQIREAVERRKEISLEILNYRKDGSSFWNALFISPIFNRAGELVYFFASQLDVSRRRGAEEALAQSQKMEALGQLTGGISHDFNNLLQVMSTQVELLRIKSERGQLTPTDVTQGIGRLQGSIGRATTLTQQLLAFSRKQELRTRVVNLNHVARSLHDLLERTLGGAVRFDYALGDDTPNCELDSTQLELALMNLMVNSRDAMPEGGTLRIETRRVVVGPQDKAAFDGLRPGTYACISVSDTGEGIPAPILDRVMDPFFTTKDDGKGTGLGLSMVYGFAKQSGGTATIYSEIDEGTCVRLYFPATEDAVSTLPVALDGEVRGGSETILVVDDRAEVADTASEMLKGLGYRVLTAYGGREALRLVQSQPEGDRPQLLFSDVAMPGGMNGYSLAMAMRSEVPRLKVLLTTGFDRDFGQRGPHAADHPVIRKPYRLQELAMRVRQILDTSV